MNSCREFEGKNVEKAVELACQQLNISKNQLKYDIISNGSSGIFSIIRNKKAKIRVTLDTTSKNKQKVINLVDEAFGVKKFRQETPEKEDVQELKQERKQERKPERRPERNVETKERYERKPNEHVPQQKSKNEYVTDKIDEEDDEETPKEKIISDFYKGKTPEAIGEEVIRKILAYVSDSFGIGVESDGENLTYHVSSDDSAVIIGKRGQNLESMQYIVDKIVNKHTLEKKRVLIDVEGYLEKRRENLERMAIRMSDKVKKTGKPSTISQMSSQDRRIVHLALKDNKSVRTQSMGEGYYRRLVIFPKKAKSRKKTPPKE
jgi:spoIIIJ-associated protein